MVLDPLEFSAPDASLDSRPIVGNMDWNPSEYVVHIEEQTRRHTEGVTSPAPLRHLVMHFHLDSKPGRNKLKPDQSGEPLPNGILRRQVDVCGSQTVPDFVVDANMDGGGNPVPKPAPSELAEHLTSVENSLRPKYPNEDGGGNPVPKPAPSELAEHLTSVAHSLRPKYPNKDKGGDPVPKPASVEHSPGPRYTMPDDKSGRRVCFYDSQTVSDLLVDFRADGGGNPVPKPAPLELAEHSTSVENSLRLLQAGPMEHLTDTPHTPIGSADRSAVGRWMVYVAVVPTSIDPGPRRTLDDIGVPPDSEIVAKFSVSGIRPHGGF